MAIPNGGVSSALVGSDKGPGVPEQLEALELALKGLHACGRALVMAPRSTFDLRPAARVAERAISCLLDGYDGRREAVTALVEGVAAAEELEAELAKATLQDPGLQPAIEWAKTSAGWLRKALGAPSCGRLPLPSPLRASVGLPSLHAPVRPTLGARFAVAEPLPPPPTPPVPIDPTLTGKERIAVVVERAAERRKQAEARQAARAERASAKLRALGALEDPPPGFVRGRHIALSHDDAIAKKARDCFEDVAALGMMRAPLLGDDWRTMTVFEERMFAALDAIVGLGPVALGQIERFVVDAPAKDATRGFAAAMLGGVVAGRDVLAVAQRVLAHLGTDEPENTQAFGEALALSPNPDIPVMLRGWLTDDDAKLRGMAIEVLARLGLATPFEIAAALGDGDPHVVAKALVPAALARLPELPGRAEELLGHAHEDIVRELPWAMALGDVPFAITRLREWLGGSREEATLLPLALAGEKDDVEHLVDLTAKRPTRPRVIALGFGGAARAVPLFVDLLRNAKDDELKLAVAYALDRMTGARLYEDTSIPAEKIDVAEPDEPDDPSTAKPGLARRISDPRDLPADGSPDRATLPSMDPQRWTDWLAARGEPFAEQLRLRRGKSYTPALTLLELVDEPLVPFERRVLHRELILKTGEALPFEPHAFVAVQKVQLDAWAEPARRASSQPGSWGRARRRGPA
jgi:hypothetical protein